MKEVSGTNFCMNVDLVLLAMGFVHVDHKVLAEQLSLKLDSSGNIRVAHDSQTSEAGVFATGDAVSGASLVVRAISAGRKAAAAMDEWLKNKKGLTS
jgi:glutamate synthase (NADPH/NADH) small chain